MKAIYKYAAPYRQDKMNLPVENVETGIHFYVAIMGFQVLSQKDSPYKYAILGRDEIQIGLAENGGDPTQEGCFFEVDNIELAFSELKANGLKKERSDQISMQNHGGTFYKVFFVVAPDGLCYCIGEKQG